MSHERIFLFSGTDSFQKESTLQAAGKHYYGKEPFEIKKFIAKSDPIGALLEELMSFSLFGDAKVVVFDGCDAIPKKELDPLIEFLKAPRGDTPFFLFADDPKKVPKALLDTLPKTQVKPLGKTTPAKIRELVTQRCEKQRVRFSAAAMKYFMDACGDSAETALRELTKILLWAGEGKEIQEEDCRFLIQTEHEKDVWSVTRAVAEKNADATLTAIHELLTHGESPVQILFLLGQSFHTMYHCKTLEEERIPQAQWPQRTGLSGYRLTKNREQSRGFTLSHLRKGIRAIRQADEDVKGGKSDPMLVVERLGIDLCRP
ncbi:MAG: DNA polymerase III subunit delta [bacterium]|jgi:DNA polymerase-3 subunit delta|nr:DNA polymerase III subunit delta [bacterium]